MSKNAILFLAIYHLFIESEISYLSKKTSTGFQNFNPCKKQSLKSMNHVRAVHRSLQTHPCMNYIRTGPSSHAMHAPTCVRASNPPCTARNAEKMHVDHAKWCRGPHVYTVHLDRTRLACVHGPGPGLACCCRA